MKTPTAKRYWTLFSSVFRISACTFGGGFVIVPLMRRRFTEELDWIDETEMMDLVSIAQSSPGPIAVNAAILIGYRTAGVQGALLAALGTALPPLLVISVISLFYQAFRDSAVVNMVMAGMLCGVAAVILDVVVNMVHALFRKKRILPLAVLAGAFAAVRYLRLNILIVILVCGLIGAVDTLLQSRTRKEASGQ